MKSKRLLILFFLLGAIYSCRKTKWNCDTTPSFANDVQPILTAHCAKCHSTFNTYSVAQQLANDGSFTNYVINTARMPQDTRLSRADRKKIYCWVHGGAPNN
jgi:hypothetical protein